MFIFQRSLLYLPSKGKIDESYYAETELKKIEFITSDGLLLKSLFKRPSSKEKSIIMVFHGNAGHVGHRVEKFRPFLEEGHGLFLVEYRGYGENPGKPSESGFYKDGQAATNFLSEQNIPKNKTILYGESLGCGCFTAKPHPKDSPYNMILFLGMFCSDKKFIAACPSL